MRENIASVQTAFYIVGIIFMGLDIVILLAVLALILAIRAKIKSFQKQIKKAADFFGGWSSKDSGFWQGFLCGLHRL